MKRVIIYIMLCMSISSCSMFPTIAKDLLGGKGQSISGGGEGGYVGEITPTLNTGKAQSYNRSINNAQDKSTQAPTNVSQDKVILAGVNKDNSTNNSHVKTDIKKDNKDTRYNATSQIVYNRTPLIAQITVGAFISIACFIIGYLCFIVGKKIGSLKTKVKDMMRRRREAKYAGK